MSNEAPRSVLGRCALGPVVETPAGRATGDRAVVADPQQKCGRAVDRESCAIDPQNCGPARLGKKRVRLCRSAAGNPYQQTDDQSHLNPP